MALAATAKKIEEYESYAYALATPSRDLCNALLEAHDLVVRQSSLNTVDEIDDLSNWTGTDPGTIRAVIDCCLRKLTPWIQEIILETPQLSDIDARHLYDTLLGLSKSVRTLVGKLRRYPRQFRKSVMCVVPPKKC